MRPMVRPDEDEGAKRERARGVLLHLEDRYEQVDEKISNFNSFPDEIQLVLDKYIDVNDTKLRKSMNVNPVRLNERERVAYLRHATHAGPHRPTTETGPPRTSSRSAESAEANGVRPHISSRDQAEYPWP